MDSQAYQKKQWLEQTEAAQRREFLGGDRTYVPVSQWPTCEIHPKQSYHPGTRCILCAREVPPFVSRPRLFPTEATTRKKIPMVRGLLDYFPDALIAVAALSAVGNEQHHPGTVVHWDRSKSTDEADSCVRHLMERGTVDTDGQRHSAKAAWRALALLQREIESER